VMVRKRMTRVALERIFRGIEFESREKAEWSNLEGESPQFEAQTRWMGKRGRVDVKLNHPDLGHKVIVEIKATDWDSMAPHRVRPNALRHARQVWRYIEAHLSPDDVVAALVYPAKPRDAARLSEIESVFDDKWIQVVWRDEVPPSP